LSDLSFLEVHTRASSIKFARAHIIPCVLLCSILDYLAGLNGLFSKETLN